MFPSIFLAQQPGAIHFFPSELLVVDRTGPHVHRVRGAGPLPAAAAVALLVLGHLCGDAFFMRFKRVADVQGNGNHFGANRFPVDFLMKKIRTWLIQ